MKNNIFINEITISIILIILLILCLNPLDVFMPSHVVMMLLITIIVLFGIFAGLIWREKPRDEREGFHRMFASRLAFLVGSTILIIGVVTNEIQHINDPWLTLALVGMIIAKMIGFLYGQKKY